MPKDQTERRDDCQRRMLTDRRLWSDRRLQELEFEDPDKRCERRRESRSRREAIRRDG